MDFYHLLKILVHMQLKLLKIWAISIVKNFLIVLKNLQQMQWKTASKRAIQKTAEATGDLIDNTIADKIISISKSSKEFHSKEFHSENISKELHSKTNENGIEIPKERYISPVKRQKIIDELR